MTSHVLARHTIVQREVFDPRNKNHLRSLRVFLDTGHWGDTQFFTEEPYISVPDTVLRKFADAKLTAAKI